jgi:hypothetical protein
MGALCYDSRVNSVFLFDFSKGFWKEIRSIK